MKAPIHYKYTLPTWSEDELIQIDKNIDVWYQIFAIFGGVPRLLTTSLL